MLHALPQLKLKCGKRRSDSDVKFKPLSANVIKALQNSLDDVKVLNIGR